MPIDNKFRVAMIGAGNRANEVMYPALSSMNDVEIAAICDIDKEVLNKTADKYGIGKRYGESVTDYQRMIKEVRPDAVFSIGQPHIMFDIWLWCLQNGLNLLIEKPMGLSDHQARILAQVAKENGCTTQVGFQRRYSPIVVKLKGECLKKGQIVHAVCRFYKYNIDPFLMARDHMMDDTVHSIDTLRWICGGEIVKIESHTKRVLVPDINFISATLYFDNGSNGYLLNSWSSGKRVFEVEMHSPGIYAAVEHEKKGYLYANGDISGVEYDAKIVAGSEETHVFTGVRALVRDFVDSCKNKGQPSSNFSDAIKTMNAANRILAQSILDE